MPVFKSAWCLYGLSAYVNAWEPLEWCLISLVWLLHVWTVERTVILSQASSSHLGESSRSSPRFCSSISLKRRILVLSDASPRSGESDSPKGVLEETWCSLLVSSSRRGTFVLGKERSRPGEKGPLRWELAEWPLCHCFKSRSIENA